MESKSRTRRKSASWKDQRPKTKDRAGSHKNLVAALKREQQLRDDLHRDLLKTAAERMKLPRFSNRSSKFAHSEIIVHRIDDTFYPDIDNSRGIGNWFKLEILDFYHGGFIGIVGIEYALIDSETKQWALLTYEQSEQRYSPQFTKVKLFVTVRIPWRNILHYDMRGDEYYPMPHVYCQFADAGTPYEAYAYFIIDEGRGYETELPAGDRIGLKALLKAENETN